MLNAYVFRGPLKGDMWPGYESIEEIIHQHISGKPWSFNAPENIMIRKGKKEICKLSDLLLVVSYGAQSDE